jgi:hypothetical protein
MDNTYGGCWCFLPGGTVLKRFVSSGPLGPTGVARSEERATPVGGIGLLQGPTEGLFLMNEVPQVPNGSNDISHWNTERSFFGL